jgi:hypothetical protein
MADSGTVRRLCVMAEIERYRENDRPGTRALTVKRYKIGRPLPVPGPPPITPAPPAPNVPSPNQWLWLCTGSSGYGATLI